MNFVWRHTNNPRTTRCCFRRTSTLVILSTCGILVTALTGCGKVFLSTEDAIVRADGSTTLVANVERARVHGVRRNLEDVEVAFHAQGRKIGTARTDDEGRASLVAKVQPDLREFQVSFRRDGRKFAHTGRVFHWRPDRTIVAVDIDETVSATQYRLLLLTDDDTSRPLSGSDAALTQLADHCQIVYITGRPRFLWEKTQRWLERNGFPPGPLITAPNLRQCIVQASFKRKELASMRETWPGALIGIGDRGADIHAYGENGMLTLLVGGTPQVDAKRHMYRFENWQSLCDFCVVNHDLIANPKLLQAALGSDAVFSVPGSSSAALDKAMPTQAVSQAGDSN